MPDCETEAEDEPEAEVQTVAFVSVPDPPRRRFLSIAVRLLPPCVWAVCIFALVLFTQALCKRPLFNFNFIVTRYSNGEVDTLATILNLLACFGYLLVSVAVLAMVCCVFSSDFEMSVSLLQLSMKLLLTSCTGTLIAFRPNLLLWAGLSSSPSWHHLWLFLHTFHRVPARFVPFLSSTSSLHLCSSQQHGLCSS
jgi:hypothetical protein